jgi:hypothetical protein
MEVGLVHTLDGGVATSLSALLPKGARAAATLHGGAIH